MISIPDLVGVKESCSQPQSPALVKISHKDGCQKQPHACV